LKTTTAFYAGVALAAFLLAAVLASYTLGYYSSQLFRIEFPEPHQPASFPTSGTLPYGDDGMHVGNREKMDGLMKELVALNHRQKQLEAKLLDKSVEASEMAHLTHLLRTELLIKEKELEVLLKTAESLRHAGRKLVRGVTQYTPAANDTEPPRGFQPSKSPSVKLATSSSESPAEVLIELEPKDANPGDPYRLKLEIHNRGYSSLRLASLNLVWKYAGRKSGGAVPFTQKVVAPKSKTLLHEVEGVWFEELSAATVIATVTLAGGDQLTNTLQWTEG
jgi:hypothetical protein